MRTDHHHDRESRPKNREDLVKATTCPSCGRPSATARALPTYRYKESGIPNLWLRGGVTETVCSSCKAKHIQIEQEPQLLQVIAVALLIEARPLTGYEMRFLRGACQMSQAMLAGALHRRRETIAEREAKPSPPGISFSDEVVLRWVLLSNFRRYLDREGNRFLTTTQIALLESFSDFFDGFSKKYVEQGLKKSKLIAALQGELWSLNKAA